MKKLLLEKFPQPIGPAIIIRFLLVIIVFLAYLAGYYHSVWQLEQRKSNSLESKQNIYNNQELIKE